MKDIYSEILTSFYRYDLDVSFRKKFRIIDNRVVSRVFDIINYNNLIDQKLNRRMVELFDL